MNSGIYTQNIREKFKPETYDSDAHHGCFQTHIMPTLFPPIQKENGYQMENNAIIKYITQNIHTYKRKH